MKKPKSDWSVNKAIPIYENTAGSLVNRIRELIPCHPEIMDMSDPWALFNIEGFKCDDLAPSLAQASWALQRAKHLGPIGEP